MYALVVRDVREQFRVERLRVVLGPSIFLALVAIAFFINFFLVGEHLVYSNFGECFRSFFYQVLAVQFFLLVVVGTFLSAGAVSTRRERLEMDFELMSPHTKMSLTAGFLVGSNAFVYLLFVLTVPFTLLSFILGDVKLAELSSIYLYLFASALFFNMLGLFTSSYCRTTASSHISAMIALVVVFAFVLFRPQTTGTLHNLSYFSPASMFYISAFSGPMIARPFFGMEAPIPMYQVVSFFFAFFSFWLFNAASRKLSDPEKPSFSRAQGLAFFTLMCVLFAGFSWHLLPEKGNTEGVFSGRELFTASLAYITFMLFILVTTAFVIVPTKGRYRRYLKRFTSADGSWNRILFHPDSMPLVYILLLFLIGVAVFSLTFILFGGIGGYFGVQPATPGGAPASTQPAVISLLIGFFMAFVVAMLYVALIQLVQMLTHRFGKSVTVLIILLLIILPFALDFILSPLATAEEGESYSRISFVYALNPVMVLAQAFPQVGLEIRNPLYALSCRQGPPKLQTGSLPQLVTMSIYLLLTLCLWGWIMLLRTRTREHILKTGETL